MEPEQHHSFEADLWRAPGEAWFFVTVPEPVSAQIRFMAGDLKGFGTVRVNVHLGGSRWKTSLFPDKASGCYFLPVKADIRRAERLGHGDRVSVELRIG